jgi:hypothetical protein
LPCPPKPEFVSDTVKAVGKFATAKAWMKGDVLKIQLTMNDAKLEIHVDSLATARTKTITIHDQVVVKEKVIPPFYRACLYIAIFLALLLALIFFIASRRK